MEIAIPLWLMITLIIIFWGALAAMMFRDSRQRKLEDRIQQLHVRWIGKGSPLVNEKEQVTK